jgi:hypothetical protein
MKEQSYMMAVEMATFALCHSFMIESTMTTVQRKVMMGWLDMKTFIGVQTPELIQQMMYMFIKVVTLEGVLNFCFLLVRVDCSCSYFTVFTTTIFVIFFQKMDVLKHMSLHLKLFVLGCQPTQKHSLMPKKSVSQREPHCLQLQTMKLM